jgi:ribosome-associated toxin RatA of RatAB toxin-antitoxin module
MERLASAVNIHKSALIGRPCAAMFDLIEAAEDYPDFMPWCAGATVLARDDTMVVARIAVDYHGARFEFTTRNPKRRPYWMAIGLEAGPFERLEGEWRLAELSPEACRIDFHLRYAFGGALLGGFAESVFNGLADRMVDAFARRAEEIPVRVPVAP